MSGIRHGSYPHPHMLQTRTIRYDFCMNEQIEAYWQLKHSELLQEHSRLKELYAEQQLIIEAYQKHWKDRHPVQWVRFGFAPEDTSLS